MKIDRNMYAISVKDLIAMLQSQPEEAMVYGVRDRLSIAQPNDGEWFNWKPLGDIILDHDQPYFWAMDNPPQTIGGNENE